MRRRHVRALFALCGFEILSLTKIPNEYWPECAAYEKIRVDSPWWMVKTIYGEIKIGWRKHVVSIDYHRCSPLPSPESVTLDEVTNQQGLVHAWTYAKAVEYLTALRRAMMTSSQS